MTETVADQAVVNLSLNDLLVRQVSALVHITAETICGKDENVLELEARLYEVLEVNCAHKAKLCKAFADFGKDKNRNDEEADADF
jgi:hypothetical protein